MTTEITLSPEQNVLWHLFYLAPFKDKKEVIELFRDKHPAWNIRLGLAIDALLNTLESKRRMVLRYRFGLGTGCAPMKFKEIGSAMGFGKNNAHMLFLNGLRRIGWPHKPPASLMEFAHETEFRKQALEGIANLEAAWKLVKQLQGMSVWEAEWSIRVGNVLKDANIESMFELCQKTEQELLKHKNFGKHSLWEVKERLIVYGLCLGMKFPQ
jgi:hypothetical protein